MTSHATRPDVHPPAIPMPTRVRSTVFAFALTTVTATDASAQTGRTLAERLDSLAGSGVVAKRAVGTVAAVVKGNDTLLMKEHLPLVRKSGCRALWVGVEDLTATLVKSAKAMQLNDLVIDAAGVTVKGSVRVEDGDLVAANFPTFALSDGPPLIGSRPGTYRPLRCR